MKIRIIPMLASAALVISTVSLAADVPQRGMSQSQVRAQFSAPNQSKGPVGSPAITRWDYDGFTVYFENNTTLHTVVNRPANTATDPVSGQQVDALPSIQEKAATQPSTPADNAFEPTTAPPAAPEAPTAPPTPEATQPAESPAQTGPNPETPTTPNTEGEFRFDPVTGRIIIAGEDTPKQAAKKQADSMKQEARQSANQARESADQAVEDTQGKAQNTVDEASKNVGVAQAQAQQEATKQTDQAKQAAQDVNDAADGGGFYIDWGARQ